MHRETRSFIGALSHVAKPLSSGIMSTPPKVSQCRSVVAEAKTTRRKLFNPPHAGVLRSRAWCGQ